MDAIAAQLGINVNYSFAFVFATLLWVRILAIVAIIPFLFGKSVPQTIRVAASFILMLFVFTHLYPKTPPVITENHFVLVALYIKEILVGVTIGLAASLIFYGFEAAGQMIDNQRGVSIARVLIPQLGEMSSLSGQFLFQLAIVIYLSLGGHLFFFKTLFESYQLIPIFEFPSIQPGMLPLLNLFIDVSADIIIMALQLASPVIIAILIADIILGVANRIAPQINVWELGFNVKGFIGILFLFLSMTLVVTQIERYTQKINMFTVHAIQLMKGKTIPQYEDKEKQPPAAEIPLEAEPTRTILPEWAK